MCLTTNRRIHRKTYMTKLIYYENLTSPVGWLSALPENGHKNQYANNASNNDDKQYFRCDKFCSVHNIQKRYLS